jgi:hypothetical protein
MSRRRILDAAVAVLTIGAALVIVAVGVALLFDVPVRPFPGVARYQRMHWVFPATAIAVVAAFIVLKLTLFLINPVRAHKPRASYELMYVAAAIVAFAAFHGYFFKAL